MPILGKAHSSLVAQRFLALGWTLRREFRAAPDEEPYEYLFEWQRPDSPPNPFAVVPSVTDNAFSVTGLELQVLCSALFFATGGSPLPAEIRHLADAHGGTFERLDAGFGRVRDAAWFEVDATEPGSRAEVIQARMRVRTSVAISAGDVLPLAALLDACRRNWEEDGDLRVVSGLAEYSTIASNFSDLQARLLASPPPTSTSA